MGHLLSVLAGVVCFGLLSCSQYPGEESTPVPADALWRADHHMHLASVDICERLGECLQSNQPPAVYASDAVRVLDEAGVKTGVVFSSGYLYGYPQLGLEPEVIAHLTRQENEFTAHEVRKYPGRLVGFFSVNPLLPSAMEELRYWQGSKELVGLKIHFTASAIHLDDPEQHFQLSAVVREAAAQGLPLVFHIGGGEFDGAAAELFIRTILPLASPSWVQIAHAGAGWPFKADYHVQILRAFANHMEQDDPLTRQVLFDLSYVPSDEESEETVTALAHELRRIGMQRFLFGSDFDVLTPMQEIKLLERLGLTSQEMQTLHENCAPWACTILHSAN